MNVGEIPKGMIVMYKDGNPMNTDPSNFELGTRSAALVRGNQTRKKDIASYSEYRNKQSQMMQAKWKSGIFKHLLGASHYRWRGGHPNSWKEYPKDFFEIREFVISRDNNKCQICSKIIAKKPHVHHRDGNKENNDQNNLLTLCASCHGKVHSKNRESPPIMALRSELHWSK